MPAIKKYLSLLHGSKFSNCLLVAIVWQAVITALASLAHHLFGRFTPNLATNNAVLQQHHIFNYMTNWDGSWMAWITQGAYWNTNSDVIQYFSPAFFPGLPGIAKLIQEITFHSIDITLISLLINTVSLAISLYFLNKIQRHLLPAKNPWLLSALFLVFPTAIFQNFFYSEALFCAISFAAYYFALRRRWLTSCLLLAVLTTVRSPAFLVIGLCGLEFMRSHNYKLKEIFTDKKFYYFFITPLGFIGYGIFLYFVRGDFFAMFHAQRNWQDVHASSNIFYNFTTTVKIFFSHPGARWFLLGFQPLFAIILGLATSINLIFSHQKEMLPPAIYGLVSVGLFYYTGDMGSLLRFSLPVLPIYLFLAQIKKPIRIIYIALGVIMQLILLTQFVIFRFAG